MTSSSDLRALIDGEPTGRFEAEQLDALLTRSLEASTMFAATAGNPAAPRPAPALAPPPVPAARAPSLSGQFLTKGSPVLVLPEPAIERVHAVAPPPPLRPPPEVLPSVVVALESPPPPRPPVTVAPILMAVPQAPQAPPLVALPIAAPAVARAPRRRKARAVAAAKTRRRPVLKFFFKLALLAIVVACQPWWWNVGDLHSARSTAPAR
jgi:hypothetical protein